MIIQFLISVLSIMALAGTFKRFKKGAIPRRGLLVWLILWLAIGVLVWVPQITNLIAGFLGVGRGADAVFYVAIVVLFYTIFRLHGKLENLEHQLSAMAKKVALRDLINRK